MTEIAGVHHLVVLLRQFYALALRFQFYVGLLILHVGSLYAIVQLFSLQGMAFLCLSGFYGSLSDALVALEKRTEAVFHAYAHIPYVQILVYRRQLEEDRSVKILGSHQSHFRQQVALGNLLLLFRYSDGVAALFQQGRIHRACRLPVSFAILGVSLVGNRSVRNNLHLLFPFIFLVHAERIQELVVQDTAVVA